MEETRVYLDVPFRRNKAASAAGAKFDGYSKCWFVRSAAAWIACQQWMSETDVARGNPWGDKDWRLYAYDDRAAAKAAGCAWDAHARSWYMPAAQDDDYDIDIGRYVK